MKESVRSGGRPEITLEQASQHLTEVLRVCDPAMLRADVTDIVLTAHEYASWIGSVAGRFRSAELADASVASGMAVFNEPVNTQAMIRYLDSRDFRNLRQQVMDRTTRPEARSLVFFGLGVRLAATKHHDAAARMKSLRQVNN